jgi:hypothetical protein
MRGNPHFPPRPALRVCETAATLIGAGTIISPIIKIVTTVAILAGIYYFVVRPILDTTENITNNVTGNIAHSQQESNAQASAAEIESTRTSGASYGRSLLAGSQPWPEAAQAVLNCVKKAGDDIQQLNRCEALGQSITSGTLSDRNFATSYADSLEAQGKTAEAQQVRSCIDKAGFEKRPMAECRRFSDQLLFG